jgi:hypothetical protein
VAESEGHFAKAAAHVARESGGSGSPLTSRYLAVPSPSTVIAGESVIACTWPALSLSLPTRLTRGDKNPPRKMLYEIRCRSHRGLWAFVSTRRTSTFGGRSPRRRRPCTTCRQTRPPFSPGVRSAAGKRYHLAKTFKETVAAIPRLLGT